MYTLSIPIMLKQVGQYGADGFLSELKRLGADTVFLALDCYETETAKQEEVFALLKAAVPLFRAAGLRVGVWVWTFMIRNENPFVHITSPNGRVSRDQVCPSDEAFCDFAYRYMQRIAESRPDVILFDDDFRYGHLDGGLLGCTCKNHRAHMEKLLGESLPETGLGKLIFGGGRSKYRSAYLRANGHFLRKFAEQSRAAVDSVDPSIRLGLCACMTTWDFDGVSAAELARMMAGKTKPFLRLIGAPYWASRQNWGNRLADVIELERMESSWCGEGIELLAEGDAYPRPRFVCPAAQLEGFDLALRASGATTGIHKYPLDYTSDVAYETGYVRMHLKNKPLYAAIEKHFFGKTPVGVRVYEHMTKFEDMDVPSFLDGRDNVEDTFFSPAARMMAAQSIPTVYAGLGTVGIAFGENAKYLDEGALDAGLILDLPAARILEAQGVDVGLASVGADYVSSDEYFSDTGRYVALGGCPASEITTKDGATPLSEFVFGERRGVGSYAYENGAGQKFLVLAFDGYSASEHALRQYARGDVIRRWLRMIGRTLPASLSGNPDCYLLAKEADGELAVWIGNFFADECLNTTVELDRAYREIEFIGCTGRLEGNKVVLDEIRSWSSLGFVVR